MRISNDCGTRLLKHSDRQLAVDGWKIVEKDVQRIAAFKVVEQGLDRYAGTSENRSSAMDLGIYSDQVRLHGRAPIALGRQCTATVFTREFEAQLRRDGTLDIKTSRSIQPSVPVPTATRSIPG